jgi:dTDP-4-dehydrorhamnose reductase
VRVLVTGAGGQLGREVVRVFADSGPVVGLARAALDVTDREAVHAAIGSCRPSVVVNCAAWTDVDGCERDPQRAHRINAVAVGYLREAAEIVGAHLVQVSTDFVFDGEVDVPYREDDPTAPLNAYGLSKLVSEELAGSEATVVRTTWLQAADRPGMVGRVLHQLSGDGPVEVLGDRRASPTFISDLVPAMRLLVDERVAGVVHATNAGVASWFDMAIAVAEAAGIDASRVIAIGESDLGELRPARRPIYSALDNSVLRTLGHPTIRHHRDAIAEAVARAVG